MNFCLCEHALHALVRAVLCCALCSVLCCAVLCCAVLCACLLVVHCLRVLMHLPL